MRVWSWGEDEVVNSEADAAVAFIFGHYGCAHILRSYVCDGYQLSTMMMGSRRPLFQ